MAFRRSELLEEIKRKRIDFLDAEGKPTGRFLEVDYRIKAMSHGQKKPLMDNVFGIQSSASRVKAIQKELENKSLSEVNRERLQTEIGEIGHRMQMLVEPLVDYLAGPEEPSLRRPPALVKWDLLDDNDQPLPITRQEIIDLDDETISFIAWQLLGDTSVSDTSKPGSSEPSEAKSQAESSTVPA